MTNVGDELTALRFERLEALFAEALDLSTGAREAFVSSHVPDDPVLARELRGLLKAHERSESLSGIAQPMPFDAEMGAGVRLGAFVVGRRIGIGGMGAVHEGTRGDAQYQQRVAVKFLRRSADDPIAVARFRAEQQFLASLQHPNIGALLDGGVTPSGTPYFVMEYIDGAPITTWCDERQATVRTRLLLFRQACLAVRAAHQRLVVHRDLKPGNIFVTADGTVKLLDFGIAKLLNDADTELRVDVPITAIGQQAFTPEYAAPEQISGETVDTRADIYALGVVLYELLAGRRPIAFTSASPVAMMQQLRDATVSRLADAMNANRWRALGERSSERARRRLEGDLDAISSVALRVGARTSIRVSGCAVGRSGPLSGWTAGCGKSRRHVVPRAQVRGATCARDGSGRSGVGIAGNWRHRVATTSAPSGVGKRAGARDHGVPDHHAWCLKSRVVWQGHHHARGA